MQLARDTDPDLEHALRVLEQRIGRVHARMRFDVEWDYQTQLRDRGANHFPIENSAISARAIALALKLTGLFWRGRRNAERVELRHNTIRTDALPVMFDGFSILQLSDLHCEMSAGAMLRLAELLPSVRYDVCVLTGDFRAATYGPDDAALVALAELRPLLRGALYGVLGNHDTIRMVPRLEQMGIRMLLNEADVIERGGQRLYIAGIDDAHFYRADDIDKAAAHIPRDEFSILLSHTPEIYRQAALAGFNLLLSGHTHGGQICLPGGIPMTLAAALPRRLGAGAWSYLQMHGYTSAGAGCSVVPVRFNCPPEITLHRLQRPTTGS